MKRGQGQWNAFVACSATREEAQARYSEVPAEFKKGVHSHMLSIKKVKDQFAKRGIELEVIE